MYAPVFGGLIPIALAAPLQKELNRTRKLVYAPKSVFFEGNSFRLLLSFFV